MWIGIGLSSLLLYSVAARPEARPEGAPPTACETLEPSHGTTPQTGPMPYHLLLNANVVESSGCVYFTIRAKPDNTFTGFMVQARDDPFGKAIGSFAKAKDVKLMECFGNPDNTATHVNSDPKTEVTLQWFPDLGFKGKAIFYATVAKNKTEYWTKQPSQPLIVQPNV